MDMHNVGQRLPHRLHLPWWAYFPLGLACFVLINLMLRSIMVPSATEVPSGSSFFLLDLIGIGLLLAFWVAGAVALVRWLAARS